MKAPTARSLVLDSQELSLLLRSDRQMVTRIEAARRVGVPVLVSALPSGVHDDLGGDGAGFGQAHGLGGSGERVAVS